ncbi:PREDICTED: uncharacterized protein LOC106815822 isoform X2 [Priapulus caudatus]|uniref:Uncharacterized protein LOC106815822 isoform X2 n=1 Tax=Priapulus caudatus TaxID=37621 RepID=A0ABM1EUF1_PRICU|nr:PREDICTED: uncharacterized protein LOC106815822 isoform X2 [Priapulus caudatus]
MRPHVIFGRYREIWTHHHVRGVAVTVACKKCGVDIIMGELRRHMDTCLLRQLEEAPSCSSQEKCEVPPVEKLKLGLSVLRRMGCLHQLPPVQYDGLEGHVTSFVYVDNKWSWPPPQSTSKRHMAVADPGGHRTAYKAECLWADQGAGVSPGHTYGFKMNNMKIAIFQTIQQGLLWIRKHKNELKGTVSVPRPRHSQILALCAHIINSEVDIDHELADITAF